MIMTNAGSALMGIGYASGDDRALVAARSAISSPLLEAAIDGARGILLNISGGSDLGLFEVNAAAEVIHGVAHPDANIIFGAASSGGTGSVSACVPTVSRSPMRARPTCSPPTTMTSWAARTTSTSRRS